MVESAISPGSAVVAPPPEGSRLGDNAETDASIAAYLGAGDRMQTWMDIAWKVCAVLLVLIVIAWALGMLPVAVKLF
jgi:hypothetical protein